MMEPSRATKSRKGKSRAESSDSSEEMDEKIWEKLPEGVLEDVIARLPFATLFRFRLVCPKWNSLLHSNSFVRRCSDVTQTHLLVFTQTSEDPNRVMTGAMYDPFMKKWRRFTNIPVDFYPAASAGGLLCFQDMADKARALHVSNPLTQTWKKLPVVVATPYPDGAVVMIPSQDYSTSRGYRIVWVHNRGEYEIYDSLAESWVSPGKISAEVTLPLTSNYSKLNSVSVDNVVYFQRSKPDGIVSYDVVSGAWEQFLIPVPPDSTELALAECEGRVLLVGLVGENEVTSVCVWEFRRTPIYEWMEVSRMLCPAFNGKPMFLLCLSNKGLLVLLLRWRRRCMYRIVTCDVPRKKWCEVPPCFLPGQKKKQRQYVGKGIVFSPCLDASP